MSYSWYWIWVDAYEYTRRDGRKVRVPGYRRKVTFKT